MSQIFTHTSILLLITLMVVKEILLSMEDKWHSLAHQLNIPIGILLIILALEVIARISSILGTGV